MPTTSDPAPGSLIASAPTCSPEISFGRYRCFCASRAVPVDLVDAEIGMRAIGQADRGRGAGDLLHRDHVLQIAHAGAAILLLDGDAEHAEIAELAPQIHRERVVAIDPSRARRDLIGREGLDLSAQHVGGLAQIEIQSSDPVGNCRHSVPRCRCDMGRNPTHNPVQCGLERLVARILRQPDQRCLT